ncbi:nucleotidyl transferase AbiEii/AbiGii toxin family protein [Candidatus Aerophobetes bacterium]|nr:nucleotidyl transferase AbiEii/AbiGii toxin family protein [Candidatus Aerophobetes bacterium]
MLDIIKSSLNEEMSREEKTHLVREQLQVLILKILFDIGAFKNLAFVGGTALRVIFGLRRFSEDLDFSLIHERGYNFRKLSATIQHQLKSYGFNVDVKENERKTVQTIMFRFKDILFKLGLSNLKEQKLSIGLEVDTHPPAGWNTDISLISKSFVFTVTHYDLPSLYATKLHACFFRRYVKGRDFYDLVWYLGKGILPNFVLLNNAIAQTEGKGVVVTEKNFGEFLLKRLENIDFAKVRKDVERFLVDKEELRLLDGELIRRLLLKKK